MVDSNERARFDAIFEKVLTEIDPVAFEEQMFCINFFQLDALSPTVNKRGPQFSGTTPGKDTVQPKKINEEVRRMMGELFNILESELLSFIMNYEKLDPLYVSV